MISEIDIRDWEKVERIIDDVSVSEWKCGALSYVDYNFLMDFIKKGKSMYPQTPALFKPQDAYGFETGEGWGLYNVLP